jgi:hypothetical protein
MAVADGMMKDVNSIVGGAATWRSISAEDTRVASRSEIDTKLFTVVLFSHVVN